MMKYETPKILVELFSAEDILTASNGDNDISDPWD